MNYVKFYHLERYLFDEVGPRFRSSGTIDPVDLFMIFVWKSNRAKTRVRDNLKNRANGSFTDAASKIASALSRAKDQKERLGVLMRDWGLRLPMASAILTVLYPDDFTVYDVRVCSMLQIACKDMPFSDRCWEEYDSYKSALCKNTPPELSLRDKDRYLWGKSFWEDAMRDAR
jgi:hypothetical protein